MTGRYSIHPVASNPQFLTPLRFNVPNADSYANKVRMADLDLDMADTEEEKRQVEERKSTHIWRGLRLASKKQLSSFDRIEHGRGLEALQPIAPSTEATGDDAVATDSGDRGSIPRDNHQSIEEQ